MSQIVELSSYRVSELSWGVGCANDEINAAPLPEPSTNETDDETYS